jgi:hypothetical protein
MSLKSHVNHQADAVRRHCAIKKESTNQLKYKDRMDNANNIYLSQVDPCNYYYSDVSEE